MNTKIVFARNLTRNLSQKTHKLHLYEENWIATAFTNIIYIKLKLKYKHHSYQNQQTCNKNLQRSLNSYSAIFAATVTPMHQLNEHSYFLKLYPQKYPYIHKA